MTKRGDNKGFREFVRNRDLKVYLARHELKMTWPQISEALCMTEQAAMIAAKRHIARQAKEPVE